MRSHRRAAVAVLLLLATGCGTSGQQAAPPRQRFGVESDSAWFAERAVLLVEFDPTYGFPASVQISNRWITDTGYIRSLERFRAIPEDRARCAAT